MILCEQCGNEFYNGEKIERGRKTFIECPYCGYYNRPPWVNNRKKSKKKGAKEKPTFKEHK